MAKVKLNPVLEQFRGQIGDLIFKRYGDEVVVSRKPDLSGRDPSAAQLAVQERFQEATQYGKTVMADPGAKALYVEEANAKGIPVIALMVADFFNTPVINDVDLSNYGGVVGDEIWIAASDDFGVESIEVAITDTDGNAIENGPAAETPAGSNRWRYAATVAVSAGTMVRVEATAYDRPGGTGMLEEEISL